MKNKNKLITITDDHRAKAARKHQAEWARKVIARSEGELEESDDSEKGKIITISDECRSNHNLEMERERVRKILNKDEE